MPHNITLIPGDGVGPEVTEATRRVLEATGVPFRWELAIAGERAQDTAGTPLPDYVIESIHQNKVALKGPITTPVGYGFRSVNVALRQALDLYACLRPCKIYPGVPSRYEKVDVVIVRENTEDLYVGIEFEKGTPENARLRELVAETTGRRLEGDTGISLKTISVKGSQRIIRFAFDYAQAQGRHRVTAVHKANILKFSDGLFLHTFRQVSREYADIQADDVIVDTLCMRLVRSPEQFDVLVLPNLYGDFVSELCAGLIGGLGVAPSANIGDGIAVFEPTHGSAPKYAGQNMVNPMAMMLSGVMMLSYLGETSAAQRLEAAIAQVIVVGKSLTYDLLHLRQNARPVGTSQVADAVVEALKAMV